MRGDSAYDARASVPCVVSLRCGGSLECGSPLPGRILFSDVSASSPALRVTSEFTWSDSMDKETHDGCIAYTYGSRVSRAAPHDAE